jgi:hypothetical protein
VELLQYAKQHSSEVKGSFISRHLLLSKRAQEEVNITLAKSSSVSHIFVD